MSVKGKEVTQVKYKIRLWLVMLTLFGVFQACTNGPISHPLPCRTADSCTIFQATSDSSCHWPYVWKNDILYRFKNDHESQTINVSYRETIRHLNAVPPQIDDVAYKQVEIPPKGYGPVGCERRPVSNVERFDEFHFSLLSSCFVGQCGVDSSLPPPQVAPPPGMSCEQRCASNDAGCIRYKVGSSGLPLDNEAANAIASLNRALLNVVKPTHVSVDALVRLVNTYTGTSDCYRTPLLVTGTSGANSYDVAGFGSFCPIPLPVQSPTVQNVEILLPGDLSGALQVMPNVSYKMNFPDAVRAPTMRVTDGSGALANEQVISVSGESRRLTFVGKNYYCAQLDVPPD